MFPKFITLFSLFVVASASGVERVLPTGTKPGSGDSTSGGLTCDTCSPETPEGCTSWTYTPEFKDYRVFNFVCGCDDRITAESQCNRFIDEGATGVEEFAVDECGVHLRCEILDFDPQPGSHSCDAKCPVGIGCFAQCSTTCAYNVACAVISTTV